jgi:hypothetical protein
MCLEEYLFCNGAKPFADMVAQYATPHGSATPHPRNPLVVWDRRPERGGYDLTRIVLSGMQFFGYHGTRPEETTLANASKSNVARNWSELTASRRQTIRCWVSIMRASTISLVP